MRDVGYKPPNCGIRNAGIATFITGIIKQLIRNPFRVFHIAKLPRYVLNALHCNCNSNIIVKLCKFTEIIFTS